MLAEYDDAGDLQVRYAYAGGFAPVQVVYGSSTETIYDVHSDHLDTPRMLTDNAGVPSWRASYQAFGKAYLSSDPDGSVVTTTPSIAFNVRFPGQYYDAESGLHYNRFRYYDPNVGRYVSADPIGQAGGINVFGYALGDPLRSADPYGLRVHVSRSGNTVTVTGSITLYGPNATNQQASAWESAIEKAWSGKLGNCDVNVDIDVSADPGANWLITADDADNYVYVTPSGGRAETDLITHRYGRWPSSTTGWEAAHEFGHFGGLGDDYSESGGIATPDFGHDNHMMGDYGAGVVPHELEELLGKAGKGCKCK